MLRMNWVMLLQSYTFFATMQEVWLLLMRIEFREYREFFLELGSELAHEGKLLKNKKVTLSSDLSF